MKRFVYNILVFASAVLAASSCVEQLQEPTFIEEEVPLSGEKTRIDFALDFGEESGTKALTENAQVKNIYVSVFDGNGYKLSEYVEAVPNTQAGTNDHTYYYSAELTVSSSSRIIHIIANAPEKLDYGSENSVIGALYTKIDAADDVTKFDFKESYWARVELPSIPKKPESDDPNYTIKMAAYNEVLGLLNGVKLVRNYSKVTAKTSAENFKLAGFWFVNYPDRGTVAPYNRNTGEFMDNYLDFTSAAAMEGTGADQGNYQGFMLATTNFITPETFAENAAGGYCVADSEGKAVGYVYEREKALSSPMYLIVKGDYTDTGGTTSTCFYKIAMQDGTGEFYAMLRNFNYLIDIQSVARKGKSTAVEALQDVPSGDISVNVDLKDLTNISDGESRITVSATTVMLVGEVGDDLTYEDFWYKYEPDIKEHSGTAYNGTSTDNASYYVTIDGSSYGESGPVFSSFARKTADTGANRYMTLVTNDVTSVPKHQTLVITGHSISGTGAATKDNKITRMVDFILRPYLTMKLKCGPVSDSDGNGFVEEGKDKPVDLSIGIESGLPVSIFPLEFSIEAENLTLTPNNDNLPARTGKSTIEGQNRSAFWFIKTVTWDEYQSAATDAEGNKYFDCHLKTNTSVSATDIYVSQQYFVQNHVSLTNFTPLMFSNAAFKVGSTVKNTPKVGEDLTFSFDMSGTPEDGKVTVALYGFDPGSGETGLTYVGNSTIDGKTYELYEYTAYTEKTPAGSGYEGSFNIRAFKSGEVSLRLDAYKFTGYSKNLIASEGNIPVYFDSARTVADADDLITNLYTDYTGGSYQPVIGQPCTITVYVANNATGTVTINGTNATRKNSGNNRTKVIDGTTYYAYYINNYSSATSGVQKLAVKVGTELECTLDIPVWDLEIDTDNEVGAGGSISFNTSGFYAIKSYAGNHYLRNGNAQDSLGAQSNFDYLCMWKFSNTTTPSMITSTGTGTTRNIITRYSDGHGSLRFRDNTDNSTWNFDYESNKGCRIHRGSDDYYLFDNGGTITTDDENTTNDNKYWHIYPVKVIRPE